ncbi:MAG: chromosome segregation protein SMC [Pseudomonadales bacterium]|nr:chromosome segregation protein SMC [Pseudomonadales bacterium]
MRLKQIKLAGFKSFVDSTTVTFPGNRSAVVGPNGCGKSNVIDAVRWVMGESSAKQLRAESLTDVIFSGSSTRKPTVQASIELLFDNSDGRIGGEYAAYNEIAIRRLVTRDSTSTYFLNGTRCRRRDIQDIFLGTGFGPRSYSIIEQGMISQLVEARPEDLRVFLEEAAGISKYKERRRETENRIKHTRENLERLNDIREELGRQLNHLKRQSAAAEKYRELKAQERQSRAELYALRLIAIEEALNQREIRIAELMVELERAQAARQALDTAIEKLRLEHTEHSDSFNVVQGQYYQLGADISRIEEAVQFNEQRVSQLAQDRESVDQRIEETQRQQKMDDEQIEQLSCELSELRPKIETAEATDKTSGSMLAEIEENVRNQQQDWESFSHKRAEHQRDAEVQASRIEHLEQVIVRLRGRLQSLDSEEPVDLTSSDGHVKSLAAEIGVLESELSALESEIDKNIQQLASAREELLRTERLVDKARAQVQTIRHELASLEAVQAAALGRQTGSSEDWIAAHELSEAPRIGDKLSVEPGWESAVEMVLGERLKGICVDDISLHAHDLEALEEGAVILLDAGQTQVFDGVLPALHTLVRSERSLGTLLHRVFAADSLEQAIKHQSTLQAGETIVTRSGVWLGMDWVSVDRAHPDDTGIIQRGLELERLNIDVEAAEKHLNELQGEINQGRKAVELLEQTREQLQQRANEINQKLGHIRADHGVHKVRLEEADARRIRLEKERSEISEQLSQELERLNEAREALTTAVLALETLETTGEEKRLERESSLAKLEVHRQKARSDRDRFHQLNSTVQGLETRLQATETARQRLLDQQKELTQRKSDLDQNIGESQIPLPKLQQELDEKLKTRISVEQKLTEVRILLEQADSQVREQEALRSDREMAVEKVRSTIEQARVERQGQIVTQTGLREQIGETGLAFEEIKSSLPENAVEPEWAEKLARTVKRIERLGPINLAAIEEFKTQSERLSYLDEQNDDLQSALDMLQGAIQKIDRETRSRFKETFEEVNSNLGDLFPKVFGGGHAYLEMTGEDLLDTGISLMARPPGKRNSSVHLLSGGEKALTAIALIFSIFRLNPSPVCMLDEVDAPLDDSNVQRFANLIAEMSESVQFIVITHNKITMEMADHLMGVTMNEPGVSRLVSVDVEEAAELAVV